MYAIRSYYASLGFVLARLKRFEEALETYEKVLELDPEAADSWFGKAVCLSFLGREEEAEDAYRRAVEIDPRYVEIGGDIQ